MKVFVNGRLRDVEPGTTMADLVRDLGHDPQRPGVAAALDGAVVRRADWTRTRVEDGATVEVLTAVQGGA